MLGIWAVLGFRVQDFLLFNFYSFRVWVQEFIFITYNVKCLGSAFKAWKVADSCAQGTGLKKLLPVDDTQLLPWTACV